MPKIVSAPFHPGYGCAIIIIMVLTFSGLVTWGIYTGLEQNKQISSFTVEDAPALPPLTPSEGDKADLRSKLFEFADAVTRGQAADLSLSIEDLNNLLVLANDEGIGTQQDSVPYATMLRFRSFDVPNQQVLVNLRLPLNKLPFTGDGKRYLVGDATLKPLIENHSFEVRLGTITVPGKTVSEGFLTIIRGMPLMNVAKQRAEVAAALGNITSVVFKPDGSALIIHASPAKKVEPPKPAN